MKPSRKQHFNDRAAPQARPMVTKAELIARLNARHTPKIERVLEPSGQLRQVVKAQYALENEKRIAVIRDRLLNAKAKLRLGFARSKGIDLGR